jgi:large subunit ribosomal protein L10
MAVTKEKKQTIVEGLTENVKNQQSLVFVSIDKMKVKDLTILRKKIREVGGKLQVAKKTLIKLVLEKSGLKVPENLAGEVALVFGLKDETSAAKSAYEFSKKHENLKILAGIFENNLLEKESVVAIAQLPTKQELLGKLVSTIAAPMSGFVNVMQGNLRGLVVVLSKIKQ